MNWLFSFTVGTSDFLLENPDFVQDQTEEALVCNKDTGGLKSLQCWSRGMFFIVSAGGHIEYWQPLYRYVLSVQKSYVFYFFNNRHCFLITGTVDQSHPHKLLWLWFFGCTGNLKDFWIKAIVKIRYEKRYLQPVWPMTTCVMLTA